MLAHSTRSMGVGYASEHDRKPKVSKAHHDPSHYTQTLRVLRVCAADKKCDGGRYMQASAREHSEVLTVAVPALRTADEHDADQRCVWNGDERPDWKG